MVSKGKVAEVVKRVVKLTKHDETGQLHPFYRYFIPTTKEEILEVAGSIQGSKKSKAANIEFFQDDANMAAAIAGMCELRSFLFSEALTQSTPGPNRGGKTKARIHKLTSVAVGFDPLRPGYEFPFDVTKGPLIIWSCVPAKNTRQELMDLQRNIPNGVKYRLYTAKGEERIEFEPTQKRPYGVITRIKSYSMPVDQFQREAVHVVSMDEKCPQYIWDECRMRLLSTGGWMILAMALYDLEVWLYEKNMKFHQDYRGKMSGQFGWYSWNQMNCPWLDQERVAFEAGNLSEDARAARVMGQPRLLSGTEYFKPTEVVSALWKKYSRAPEFAMKFDMNGRPSFPKYQGNKGWKVWQQPKAGHTYAIGADVAEGLGGDADSSAAHVLCLDTNEIVAVFESNLIEADEFGLELFYAGETFNTATIAIEVNVERAATHLWLRKNGYPRIYQRRSFGGKFKDSQETFGWYTDSRSKEWALEELRRSLKAAHDEKHGGVILYDADTYEQISDFGFLRETRRRAHGLGGLTGHDDLVMSLAIAIQAATQAPQPKMMVGKKILSNTVEAEIERMFEQEEKARRNKGRGALRVRR